MRLLPWEYGVRNLGRSPLRLALIVGGAALVSLLVLAAAAFVRGMERSLSVSAGARNIILLGAGSEESVERSEIKARTAGEVHASVRGIKQRLGVPFVSPEIHMMAPVRETRDAPRNHRVLLRGVTSRAFLVHDRARIVDGHAPRDGHDELLVGARAADAMGIDPAHLVVGAKLWIDDRPWTVCGTFEAPGTVLEAEMWTSLEDLKVAARRETISCVVLTLDQADFADVDVFCKERLDLELVAMRESDYYAKILDFYRPIRVMVWLTAVLVAFGGLFGGLNTLYAAFAMRVREFASLQALGFSRLSLVVSMLQESVLAAAAGALAATALGLLLLDGWAVKFSMGAFGLVVDAPVVGLSLCVGLLLGVVGALPPAWRCLRPPITDALRSG